MNRDGLKAVPYQDNGRGHASRRSKPEPNTGDDRNAAGVAIVRHTGIIVELELGVAETHPATDTCRRGKEVGDVAADVKPKQVARPVRGLHARDRHRIERILRVEHDIRDDRLRYVEDRRSSEDHDLQRPERLRHPDTVEVDRGFVSAEPARLERGVSELTEEKRVRNARVDRSLWTVDQVVDADANANGTGDGLREERIQPDPGVLAVVGRDRARFSKNIGEGGEGPREGIAAHANIRIEVEDAPGVPRRTYRRRGWRPVPCGCRVSTSSAARFQHHL